MRVFYVIPITERYAAPRLDAIRYICNPLEKTTAHITVRGPYSQHYRLPRANVMLRNTQIAVGGVGRFFGAKQSTVFLKASGEALRSVWHKPDFADFNPHVTLYDGHDRHFAILLHSMLEQHEFCFQFKAKQLEPLRTQRGQSDSILRLTVNLNLISRIAKESISIEKIHQTTAERRLAWVELIAQDLARNAGRRVSRSAAAARKLSLQDHSLLECTSD
jgi:hypothetical protein